MRGQHLRGLTPHPERESEPGQARHVAALARWRQLSLHEQWLAMARDDASFVPGREPADSRIKVGLFCPCLGLGGAEAWQLALVEAIDPTAVVWRGAVVTQDRTGVAPRMLGELIRRMPIGFGLNAARTLAMACDVVLSWSVLDHGALFRGIDAPPRVVLACHFPGERPWTNTDEKLLTGVDQFVAVSELAVESLPLALRGQARVIWNAVDDRRVAARTGPAATRARWGVPPGAKVAGYLGRLAPEKDPGAMLRLAGELPEPWHVVVVGDGREAGAMAAEVAQRQLNRVHLIPGTVEVGDVLVAFDTLVVPSRFESFGLTMAEGFWAGVPVVATHSGLAKLVPSLVREVGFEPSGAEIARAILLDHGVEQSSMVDRVARARSFAHQHLSLERFGREWLDLIRTVATSARVSNSKEERCRPTPQIA